MAIVLNDVVKLKSGGPRMTVLRFIGDTDNFQAKTTDELLKFKGFKDGDAICQWFDPKNELKSETFPIGSLEKSE